MRAAALAVVLGLVGIISVGALAGCGERSASVPFPTLHPASQDVVLVSAPVPAPPKPRVVGQPLTTPVVPTGISIPAIGVESSDVAPMGLQKDGSPQVPPLSDVHQLGFYCPGHAPLHCGAPLPGQVGPAVLVAHVNGNGKLGLFNNLWKLKPSDEIVVNLNGSRRAVFTVHRVITVPKTKFPYQDVWGVVDHPALRLVTCGPGPVVDKNYLDSTVVFADLDQVK
jgi:hypothetical protein